MFASVFTFLYWKKPTSMICDITNQMATKQLAYNVLLLAYYYYYYKDITFFSTVDNFSFSSTKPDLSATESNVSKTKLLFFSPSS